MRSKTGDYVGNYQYMNRTCCKKTMKMTVRADNDDVTQTTSTAFHTCDTNYDPVLKKSKKLDSGVIDLTEELHHNAEKLALENPKLSGKQVADTVFKEIEKKYKGEPVITEDPKSLRITSRSIVKKPMVLGKT